MLDWLYQWLQAFVHWLYTVIVWIPKMVWKWLLEALSSVLQAIPVPDFVTNIPNMFAGIPPGVMYFAGFLQLGTGVSIVVTAYIIRFGIRRIPVIG